MKKVTLLVILFPAAIACIYAQQKKQLAFSSSVARGKKFISKTVLSATCEMAKE